MNDIVAMNAINEVIEDLDGKDTGASWDTVAVIEELYWDGRIPSSGLEVNKDSLWRRKHSEKHWGPSFFFDEVKTES